MHRQRETRIALRPGLFEANAFGRDAYARQGKGYFVAPIDAERRRSVARDQARSRLERPLSESRAMGLPDKEIVELVRVLLRDEGKEHR